MNDPPPADLILCPQAPEGFPTDAAAQIPAPVRAAMKRIAAFSAATHDQLVRLIRWHVPGACAGDR
uniref:hypothetical protein n=1 Tax=Edaphosphingomonas laterariae TaxID=861865 RepID=UPI001FEB712E|nr:hypothetical protein [Sphingomonas laterariae]